MGSERERFEAWFVGKYGHDIFVESDWEAWQAAKAKAVPDGFVVVPREPTVEMEMDLMKAGAGFLSRSFYKAMIESQEKENGC